MANEKLTIQKSNARTTVIGRSYPDENTDSGAGWDLTQQLIDILGDLGIDLPDIDFDDWDDIDAIIGYDDEGWPELVFPDPDTGELNEWDLNFPVIPVVWPEVDVMPELDDGWPVIEFIIPDTDIVIDWPINLPDNIDPDDWPDFDITPDLDDDGFPIISFEDPDTGLDVDLDLGLDLDILIDMHDLDWDFDIDIAGLDGNGLNSVAFVDSNLNVHIDNLPDSIQIVTLPLKLEYFNGRHIDITGMIVTAKKADGSTWTSAKYPNGHIPLGELVIDPKAADLDNSKYRRIYPTLNTIYGDGYNVVHRNAWNTQYYNTALQIGVVPSGWSGWPAGSPLYAGSSSPFSSTILLTAYNGHWYAMAYPNAVGAFMICCPAIHGYAGTVPTEWGDFGGIGWAGNMIPESSEDPIHAEYVEKQCEKITVTWLRPGDETPLSAEFEISVEEVGGNGGR